MKKKWALNIILVIAIAIFCFSAVQLYLSTKDYREGEKEYDNLQQQVVEIEPEDKEDIKVEKTESKKKDKIEKTAYKVDFETLRKINSEVVGWIRFDEPEIISYPLVQTGDNDKYLTTTFEGKGNKVGALFLDKDNQPDFADENTFIYGHNMKDGSMFGRLRKYKQKSFFEKYPYFYIYTPDKQVHTYQIYSVEITNDTSKSFQKYFSDGEEYLKYLEMVSQRSLYRTNLKVNENSKMVSLSTCTNVSEEERLVVHGILVDTDKVK